jgi:hypothetical protein
MPVEPFVDHGIGQLLRLVTATIYSFSGAFNVPWKNGYDPSVSFDAGTDGVSDTPVLHRGIVRRNWKLSNRFYPTMVYGYSTYLSNCSRILTFKDRLFSVRCNTASTLSIGFALSPPRSAYFLFEVTRYFRPSKFACVPFEFFGDATGRPCPTRGAPPLENLREP